MIHYRDATDPSRPGAGPRGPLFTPIMAHDPLNGPARHRDPVAAMAEDLRDILGARGCVEEVDLAQRGWTAAEIVEHFPDARARVEGRHGPVDAPAGRVPA